MSNDFDNDRDDDIDMDIFWRAHWQRRRTPSEKVYEADSFPLEKIVEYILDLTSNGEKEEIKSKIKANVVFAQNIAEIESLMMKNSIVDLDDFHKLMRGFDKPGI